MKKNYTIVTLILILCMGAVLSGCGPDRGSLLLSFSDEKIELNINEEKADFNLQIENYFEFNAQFSFDFSSDVARLVDDSVEHLGEGKFKFSLTPIKVGNATLIITLKGINQTLSIPVNVYKQIETITAKTNKYIEKTTTGGQIRLDNTFVDFQTDTTQTELSFELAEIEGVDYAQSGVTLNNDILKITPDCELGSISVVATSKANSNIKTTINIKVLHEIELSSLKIGVASQKNDNPKEFDESAQDYVNMAFDYTQTEDYKPNINLIISEKNGYQKKIKFNYDLFLQGYQIDVISSGSLTLGGEKVNRLTFKENDEFVLSSSKVEQEQTLTFRIYEPQYEGRYKDVVIYVTTICKPRIITVNNQTELGLIDLYTNSNQTKDFSFNIAPKEAIKENYNYFVSFYAFNAEDDGSRIPVEKLLTDKEIQNKLLVESNKKSNLNDFLEVYYAGELLNSNSLGKLTAQLSLKPVKANTENQYLAIKIDCREINADNSNDADLVCSRVLFVKVYQGTEEFKIDDTYIDGTIYIPMPANGEEISYTFYGIRTTDNATIGKLNISSDFIGEDICEIVQEDTNFVSANLKITPKKVGVQEFVITTPTNKSVILKVVIFRELDENGIVFHIADTTNDNIADFEPKDNNENLTSLTLKGKNVSVNIGSRITTEYNDYNDLSYSYTMRVDSNSFEITNNRRITSRKFTEDPTKLTISLKLNKVKRLFINGKVECGFTLDAPLIITIGKQETGKEKYIELSCVNYIKELTLYTSTTDDGLNKIKTSDIYNKDDLSYVDQHLANAYLFVDLLQSEQGEYDKFSIDNLTFKSGAVEYQVTKSTDLKNVWEVGNIGTFRFLYPNEEEPNKEEPDDKKPDYYGSSDNGLIGVFTYNFVNNIKLSSISIEISVQDEDTKVIFNSAINLNIKDYIKVKNIYLSTPTKNIYLDNTEANRQVVLSVILSPANAMCQDIDILVETGENDRNCVLVNVNKNVITLTYQKAGSGKIRIFAVSNKKTNENISLYPSTPIDFVCADGSSEDKALKLSNYQDLLSIKPNLHYFVDGVINCNGNYLDIPELSGSIRGTFLSENNADFSKEVQLGSIINYKVKANNSGNVGAIRVLKTGAKIYNISFSGYFDEEITVNTNSNIGLVCGQNNGTITNVEAEYYNESKDIPTFANATESQIDVYVGLLVGNNKGAININDNAKNSTLLVKTNTSSSTTVKFNNQNLNSYFGAVVGLNEGTFENQSGTNDITIGLYGIHTSFNINTNAGYVGGVVGKMSGGTISGLKVSGEIKGFLKLEDTRNNIPNTSNVTAGFIATISGGTVANNTSRIFVRGAKTVGAFVGEEEVSITFTNNLVQAVDDGTRKSVDASLLICYNNSSLTNPFKTTSSGLACETYFTRNKPSNMTNVDADLSLDYYYGDVVEIKNEGDIVSANTNTFTAGQSADFRTADLVEQLVIAGYIRAKNKDEQYKINNSIATLNILQLVNINTNTVKDFNIEILSPNTANIKDYGKFVNLAETGDLTIKIYSALNYKIHTTLNLHITDYYSQISVYDSKSYINKITNIDVKNNKTSIVYFQLGSDLYNYNNTPVELACNQTVTFDIDKNTDLSNNFNTEIQGQTLFVTAKSNTQKDITITFKEKYVWSNNVYYRIVKNNNNLLTNNSNMILPVFVKNADILKFNGSTIHTETKNVNSILSIQNIKVNKNSFQAEPTDVVTFELNYEINNDDDKLIAEIKIDEGGKKESYIGKEIESKNQILFKDKNNIKTLFELEWVDNIVENNFVSRTYTFKMYIVTEFDEDIYNLYKNSKITLSLSSSKVNEEKVDIEIQYQPESISSVLLENYNPQLNEDIIKTVAGITEINHDKMLNASNQNEIGEYNIINAHIYTKYAEFEYVEIVMQTGVVGGYLGAVQYIDNVKGVLYPNVVYTTIDTTVVLRIYKNANKNLFFNPTTANTLMFGVIYRIPYEVVDGSIIPISFNFYNSDNSLIKNETISIYAKRSNQVSFDVFEKTPIETSLNSKTYQVVRGKTYPLVMNLVGFAPEEAIFETSNASLANIERDGNNFYLVLSNVSINYDNKDFEQVTIRSYGQKLINGNIYRSGIKETVLNIYEVLLNSPIFQDDLIVLKYLENTNIHQTITELLSFESSRMSTNLINSIKKDYIENIDIIFIDENGMEYETSNIGNLENNMYRLSTKIIQIDNKDIKTFVFTPKVMVANPIYKFKVKFDYVYSKGVPAFNSEALENKEKFIFEKDFNCSVFVATTGDKPLPISNYQELISMIEGENYRLVNDITINASQFVPIQVSPKSFDGNGYKIIVRGGSIDMINAELGLFANVKQGSTIKNLTLQIQENLLINANILLTSNDIRIGLLAVENSGVIYNCFVQCSSVVTVDIKNTIAVMERAYFAGFVAVNNGQISNSRVESNLNASGCSLAGFVAMNNGLVSSSYVKKSRIYNTTSTSSAIIATAGFVLDNSGTIKMSYVEGTVNQRIFANYVEGDIGVYSKIIYSATRVSGFVFNNMGSISDCYANIPIVSTNDRAGFVFNATSGKIERVFSLCKLQQDNTKSFAFVANYELKEDEIRFKDCYFVVQNGLINDNTSKTNYIVDNNVNRGVIEGVEPLSISDFSLYETNGQIKDNYKLKSFIANDTKENGVWFYVNNDSLNNNTPTVVDTYFTTAEGITNANGQEQSFSARTLHLVAPNIIAFNQYDLVLDENSSVEEGEYTYCAKSNTAELGTRNNPYIIQTAQDLERLIKLNNKKFVYYRQICDVDYFAENIYSSKLYDVILNGNYEGNGFTINNISVNSSSKYITGGYIGQIGVVNGVNSTMKNLNFIPYYINLPNCSYVGTVTGNLVNANLFNITVDAPNVIVVGSNIVGGVVGRTYLDSKLKNIYSNISAKATTFDTSQINAIKIDYSQIKNMLFDEKGSNRTKVSYAGSIAGYIGGITEVSFCEVGKDSKVMGVVAGLMFGGVNALSNISNFSLELNSFDNKIISYLFGGYVAGALSGKVTDFEINSQIIHYNMFELYPLVPLAIGGVAGYSQNAIIKNMKSTDGYSVIGVSASGVDENGYLIVNNPFIVKHLGGLIGFGETLTIDTINIGNGSGNAKTGLALMGGEIVGGLVGYINGFKDSKITSTIKNANVHLLSSKTFINQDEQEQTINLYFSYVKQANLDAYQGYNFKQVHQHFGVIYGFGATNNDSLTENFKYVNPSSTILTLEIYENNTVTLKEDEQGLKIYYAAYEINNDFKSNFKTDRYNINDGTNGENIIIPICVNLSDNSNIEITNN